MLRKIISSILLVSILVGIIPTHTWALSSGIASPENYPGKMDIRSVNGLGKNISTDFFGGAMTFRYPFSFPVGSRGMTPSLSLSYASNNTDAFSPYGYGFSLSTSRIQRSAKKGVSELYIGDEFSAFGNDLVKEVGSGNKYRSKDGNDLNLYIQSGSSWIVQTPEGKTLTFGGIPSSRIADPVDSSKIYAWLVDEEGDSFGHTIRYSYFQDGGQPYLSDVYYGYESVGINPMYQIHFDYINKGASLTSYRTQFEVNTKKLLSQISLKVGGVVKHTYSFTYDNPDNPTSHLTSISESALGINLPKTQFSYGVGQFQHIIVGVDNNRGGKANFEYSPSTGYRDNSGILLNGNLPFMVMTLSKQMLEDAVTGIKSEESYSYSGGHYYYDSSDLWGREYVGFGQVTTSDDKTRKIFYFHQSQTARSDTVKYQDHISKKGRIYRTDVFDKISGKILQEELVKYDSRLLFGERRLVVPIQKMGAEFAPDGSHRDTTTTYEYDNDGNLTTESRLGLVNANLSDGTYTDIPGDTTSVIRDFVSNTSKNLHNFQTKERIYGFSGELLSLSSNEYDNVASGVTLGLLTAKKKQNVQNGDIIITDRIVYSPTGMPIERYDAMNNKTSSVYDTRDIALISSMNPLGWTTRYLYDYSIGKPIQVTNQNNVVSTTHYDGFGRVTELLQNTGSGDILLTRNSYDDINIPNSTTSTQYFDTLATDSKTTKSYMDGWGRTIATISTTEKSGQYSASQIRYDDDGNPIYAGYPIFVSSDVFDTSLVLKGVTNGESYRAIAPGMSYQYDAIDRIISQKDARGVTTKSYLPGKEIITNALGYATEARYDGYGNLASFIEKIDGRDIVTSYTYDGLGRPTKFLDTYNNTRTWMYDGLGRLQNATDLHTPSDATYGMRAYMYDSLDRVTSYTNANNETLSYQYDTLSRIIHESSTTSGSTLDRTYSYDTGDRSLGTLSSVSDAGSRVSYAYDPLGRKTGETRTIGDTSYTLEYGYSPASVLTDIFYPDGGHAKYTYKNGFIEGVGYTSPNNDFTQIISDISYAPNSTMKSIRYGNGIIKNTERDANNNYRLTRATATSADGTKLLDTSYGYDAINNITSIIEGGIEPLRKSIGYTYDPLTRLMSASYSYSIAGYGRDQTKNFSYSYNDIGNIMSATDVGSYTYAGINFSNPHAVTTAGDTSYGYDTVGNTITRTNTTNALSFAYSPYGEMLSSMKNGEVTNYLYDHTHRRIVKSTFGLTEHHIIDGFEVEYESGALVPVNNEPIPVNNTGTTDSSGSLTNSGTTNSGSILSNSGTSSGSSDMLANTGSTASGIVESGAILTDSGTTNTGATDTGSLITDSGSIMQTGSTQTGTSSGSGEVVSFSGSDGGSGTYIVIAGYTTSSLSGATPITLITALTHIYLGDEKIATFQSQTDDTPKTLDDDKLIFHIADHLNSSSLDLSSTGVVLQATDYQPFGKTITYQVTSQRVKGKKGGYKNKYLFANKQQDNETDLQYFEKRYYDNRIGRFTTEDPVFWEVGLTKRPSQYFTDPQSWNTYSYTRNNPINLVDPTGEFVMAIPLLAAALGVEGVSVTIVCTSVCTTAFVTIAAAGSVVIAEYTSSSFYKAMEGLGSEIYDLTHKADSSESNSSSSSTQSQSSETTSTTSPPPDGGGGKKDDKKGENRGNNRNTTPAKDYAQIAKEKGMKETKEFGTIKGQKIYQLGNKYYSPEKTSHNTNMGWKVFEKGGGRLNRIGTADKNLNVFKK